MYSFLQIYVKNVVVQAVFGCRGKRDACGDTIAVSLINKYSIGITIIVL